MYGSQKGQAQSIAEQLSDQAVEYGFEAEISCLSKGNKVKKKKINHISWLVALLILHSSVFKNIITIIS